MGLPDILVIKAGGAGDAKLSHAIFRTFDGLEVDVAGRKDGSHDLIALTARSTAKETADEAQKRNEEKRLQRANNAPGNAHTEMLARRCGNLIAWSGVDSRRRGAVAPRRVGRWWSWLRQAP